jgi:hypothetical protein
VNEVDGLAQGGQRRWRVPEITTDDRHLVMQDASSWGMRLALNPRYE